MNITTKRRPTVGDKVRILRDFHPYESGDIITIIKDDHDCTPYYCKFADNSFHWVTESFVELVEPVAPRRDPRIFGNSQVGSELITVPVDSLADLKAAWNAGRGVRPKGEKKYFYKCKYEESFPGWEWHPLLSTSHYEIEPEQAPVDPYEKLRQAAKDGKRIRLIRSNGEWGHWELGAMWSFTSPPEHYEIEPDPIPEPKIEWVLGDKYLTRGGQTAVLVQFDPGTKLPNRLVFLSIGQDNWVTDAGKNFSGQTKPHAGDIVKHLKDKA